MTEQFAVAMLALIPVLALVTRVDYQRHATYWLDVAGAGYSLQGSERRYMLVSSSLALAQFLAFAYLIWWLAATTRPEHPIMAWFIAGSVVAQFGQISLYVINLPRSLERLAKERRRR
ncbi:hypothetical protein N4P33_02805 [Streptomyces sp. 15-116A]|uniref:hypothetical protein n=1 Tax=Streptomyces sp. 15-116A TaxID=2259035 RepID=UPI0021B42A7D|nr:hypothetical protein [Streptomyces sp. 15-116A]MCT7351105.1 hypothetical protein [Streptomyces sp. 15-116A]